MTLKNLFLSFCLMNVTLYFTQISHVSRNPAQSRGGLFLKVSSGMLGMTGLKIGGGVKSLDPLLSSLVIFLVVRCSFC